MSFLKIKVNSNQTSFTAIVIESKSNYYIVISKFERLIIYENNNNKEVGDILNINGKVIDLIDNTLESEFNFINYLKNKGVERQIQIKEVSYIFQNFIKLKAYKTSFLNLFDLPARDYIDAFLFNVKNYDNQTIATASNLSINYFFSSSGVYLALLFKIVEYLLFLKFNKKHTKIFALIFLSWYLIFTFNKISVRRIVYLKIFSLINEYKLKNKFSYLESVSLIGVLMLLANYYLARQSAFYIGLFLSISLILLKSYLNSGKKIIFINKTSIFIFFFIFPISIVSSNTIHIFSFFIQIVITPIMFIFSLSGIISFYTYPIRGYFNIYAKIIDGVIKGVSYIDLQIYMKTISSYFIFLYYLLFFLCLYFLEEYSKRKARNISFIIASLLILKSIPYECIYIKSITFLNIGQGDSALIRLKDKNILIDTGGLTYKDVATNVIIPYLKKNCIYKLDYVFISHSDYDHSGALLSLKTNFNVKEVIDTSDPFKININELEIENINKWAKECDDVNDKSQVLKFKIDKYNVLMMGDASTKIENYIMNEYPSNYFNIDILKLGHHGSKTSSSYEFLKYINPKNAIISVGMNNKFGHPDKTVIENLNALNIPYSRTDINGTITFSNSFI